MMRTHTCLIVTCLAAAPALAHPGHDAADSAPLNDEQVFYTAAMAALQNEVTIEVRGKYRYITSNGIPDHEPGQFPTQGNPNRISEQSHSYRLPVEPTLMDRPSHARGMPFGVAINGVPFDPGTAEIWTAQDGKTRMQPGARRPSGKVWNYDALSGKINLGIDQSNAHVQPTGTYHYHGIPTGLVDLISKDHRQPKMVMVGYAADGFPVYSELGHADADDASSELKKLKPSYQLKEGSRPDGNEGPGGKYDGTFIQDFEYVDGSGDLDACNGRTGVTPEYPDGTYYYVLTDTYPFIPRMLHGEADSSFQRRGGGEGRRGNRDRQGEGEDDRRRPPRDGDRPPPPRW